MRYSRRQLSEQKNLSGWIVLHGKFPSKVDLALNFGPTIVGPGWGFDWVNRATVFKDKTAACKALRNIPDVEERDNNRVVSVANVAIMSPRIGPNGGIEWRATYAEGARKHAQIAQEWSERAKGVKVQALQKLAYAKRIENSAKRLRARDA